MDGTTIALLGVIAGLIGVMVSILTIRLALLRKINAVDAKSEARDNRIAEESKERDTKLEEKMDVIDIRVRDIEGGQREIRGILETAMDTRFESRLERIMRRIGESDDELAS